MLEVIVDKPYLRKFGYTMAAFIAVVFGLVLPWLWGFKSPTWAWVIGAVFAVLAIVWPMGLGGIYRVWMKLAGILAWINTRIILGLVFIFVFTPIGLVMRIIGKDTLEKSFDANAVTYRKPSKVRKPNHLERQF
jgi:hypothetical protein